MKIVENSISDEEQAFELLFRRYYLRLCGFANKFIANTPESEEIVYKNQAEDFNTYESVLYNEFQAKAETAIESLPEQCRRIFKMSRQDGLKYTEIAEKLGISVKTVETQMSRALSKLKTELRDYLAILLISIFLNY